MAREQLKDDDASGAGAEHDCRLIAEVLNKASQVVGIGLQPVRVILRPV
jgi:hypothetical protein